MTTGCSSTPQTSKVSSSKQVGSGFLDASSLDYQGENESSRYHGVDERFDRHESERYLIGHSVSNGGLHSP
jgi:hypothetical protein